MHSKQFHGENGRWDRPLGEEERDAFDSGALRGSSRLLMITGYNGISSTIHGVHFPCINLHNLHKLALARAVRHMQPGFI